MSGTKHCRKNTLFNVQLVFTDCREVNPPSEEDRREKDLRKTELFKNYIKEKAKQEEEKQIAKAAKRKGKT